MVIFDLLWWLKKQINYKLRILWIQVSQFVKLVRMVVCWAPCMILVIISPACVLKLVEYTTRINYISKYCLINFVFNIFTSINFSQKHSFAFFGSNSAKYFIFFTLFTWWPSKKWFRRVFVNDINWYNRRWHLAFSYGYNNKTYLIIILAIPFGCLVGWLDCRTRGLRFGSRVGQKYYCIEVLKISHW